MRHAIASFALVVALAAQAQTLARPHWAGSGVVVEPWWQRAVFYHLDPARFQDSDGDGKGDIPGVLQRMDYIQSLGVDALVVEVPSPDAGMVGFDDLARQAAARHLRVMVSIVPAADDRTTVAAARYWLNQGAAGIFVSAERLRLLGDAVREANLLHQLHGLTAGFPGGRVLIAGVAAGAPAQVAQALSTEATLVLAPPIDTNPPTALNLRIQLRGALVGAGANGPAILHLAGQETAADPARRIGRALAVLLLATRNPVLIEAGEELGLAPTVDGADPLMQWTPTNLTAQPKPADVTEAVQVSDPSVQYKAFHAFVPPPPRSLVAPPKLPEVVLSDEPPPLPPELQPGFTLASFRAAVQPLLAANGAAANVQQEETDAGSLLSLYRRLIQLRHGDASLRSGTQTVLDRSATDPLDALNVLAWVRRVPVSARTSSTVVVVCNLSDKTVHMSVDDGLGGLRLRPGSLRNLLGGPPQSTAELTVEPSGVFVGELGR